MKFQFIGFPRLSCGLGVVGSVISEVVKLAPMAEVLEVAILWVMVKVCRGQDYLNDVAAFGFVHIEVKWFPDKRLCRSVGITDNP